MKQMNHPNLLRLHDHYFSYEGDRQFLHLITDLYHLDLRKMREYRMIEKKMVPVYLYQILKGLQGLN